MTSNDEAAYAAVAVHMASETNLTIPLISSRGTGDAIGVEATAKATQLPSGTAAPTRQVTPHVAVMTVGTETDISLGAGVFGLVGS